MNAKNLTIDDLDALLTKAADPKAEAISNADAHTNNAGLPTYSELVEALRAIQLRAVRQQAAGGDLNDFQDRLRECADDARALLSRIPT